MNNSLQQRPVEPYLEGLVKRLPPYTSHFTPHTAHNTTHTSHQTPHTSIVHLKPRTSHLTSCTAHLTPRSSHLTPHSSHLPPATGHITGNPSHLRSTYRLPTSTYCPPGIHLRSTWTPPWAAFLGLSWAHAHGTKQNGCMHQGLHLPMAVFDAKALVCHTCNYRKPPVPFGSSETPQ